MSGSRNGTLFLNFEGRQKLLVMTGLLIFALPLSVTAQVRSSNGSRRVVADVPPITEHRVALQKIDDCDELRLYAADVMLETLINYRYGWNWRFPNPWSQPGGETDSPGDFTTTNNQEEGVDELDLVKTNGTHIYTVQGNELIVVRSWPAATSEMIARVDLGAWGEGLLLHDNLVAVISRFWNSDQVFPRYFNGTGIQLFDISNPARPELVRSIEIEGYMVGARLIAGQLYAVIMANMPIPDAAWNLIWSDEIDLPEIDWNASEEEYLAAAEAARLILQPLILEIALGLEPADLLPLVKDSNNASELAPLFECSEIYRTAEPSEYSVLSVVHLDLNGPSAGRGELDGAGIMANGCIIYASTDRLYVAQSSRWWWWGFGALDKTTAIHVFELGTDPETPVRYTASGEVPGWLQSQFAMSEYQDHVRVATTLVDWWWGFWDDEQEETGSVVTVLKDNNSGILETVGQVRNIAPGEQIVTSRMMGDVGYLVTFERIDPLFTLDLSDPTDPRVVGELEMPGFSAYLHPADEDHLLAVGMAGEENGSITGLAINLFNVADLNVPLLEHQYVVDNDHNTWSWSEALNDHHAFTYHRGVLSIPAYLGGDEPFSGLLVFVVYPGFGVWKIGEIDHLSLPKNPDEGEWNNAQMRRSIYIEDNLFSLSERGIKVNDLQDPSIVIAEVPFY